MNYQMLKSIIDSLIQNFKCPDCQTSVSEKDVEVMGAAGKTINIDVGCPKCSKHTMVKAEISSVNIGNFPVGDKEAMEKLRGELTQKLSSLKGFAGMGEIKVDKKETTIDEKEIMDLRKKLKEENVSASDFLN